MFGAALDDLPATHRVRLPRLWRLCWPTIDAICARSPRQTASCHALMTLLARAGLPAAVLPGHVVVARRLTLGVSCGLVVAVYAALIWMDALMTGFSDPSAGAPAVLLPGFQTGATAWIGGCASLLVGIIAWRLWPDAWLRRRGAARRAEIERQFPFLLDLVVLGVQAGLNMQGALVEAVANGPPGALREELARVLSDIRAGQPRGAALLSMADRANVHAVYAWVAAVAQADALGMSIAPRLSAQAEALRDARFERAEQLALEAPVKMLFPLIVFFFPCTFIVIAFPIWHAMQSGLT